MADGEWKGGINAILYGLIFTRELDDAAVRRIADAVIAGQTMPAGPAVYYAAIEPALRSGEALNDVIEAPHSEAAIRDFLARLAAELDARRPWPPAA
jgi:hypothetical protein